MAKIERTIFYYISQICYLQNLQPSKSYVISVTPFNIVGDGVSSAMEIRTPALRKYIIILLYPMFNLCA